MSGGSLHGYYNLERIAEEIERMIIDQRDMGPEIIGRYKTAVALCRAAFHAVKAVDYLDSGDYGRESFVVAWDELVKFGPSDVLVALSRPDAIDCGIGTYADVAKHLAANHGYSLPTAPSVAEMCDQRDAQDAGEMSEQCQSCNGNGWTAEHDPCDPHEDGICDSCPIQVQCEDCNGTGYATAPQTDRGEG